jgi:DNA polymerase-3 subunit delta'
MNTLNLTLPPRLQRYRIGHEGPWNTLLSQFQAQRLNSAWILSGSQGIGKSTIAYQFSRYLLGEGGKDPENAAFYNGLIDQNAHPNMLVIEPQRDEEGNLAGEIKVDDIRPLRDFTQYAPTFPGWRVVLIDSLDHLNQNAANALLKILEEPPPFTIFLCISHSLGRVLPTIRSRCCLLPLHPLDDNLLPTALNSAIPLTPFDLEIASGSLGRLHQFREIGGVNLLFKEGISLLSHVLQGRLSEVIAFNSTLEKKDKRVPLFLDLISWISRRFVLLSTGMAGPLQEDRELHRLAQLHPPQHWLKVQRTLEEFIRLSEGAHLDQGHLLEACLMIFNTPEYYGELGS